MDFYIWHGIIVLGIMLISFGAGYFTALKQLQKGKTKVQKFTHW
tara:strand:- start:87 stop:218 length:132 start_codon:yes stop_codon:yes gene_type:complete